MHYLTIEQRETLQAELEARAALLSEEVIGTFQGAGGAGAIPDRREETDDDAIVDLEASLDADAVQRRWRDLRAVEQALVRLHTPDYGECAQCGADIPFTRLHANPLATRCTACQGVFELEHRQKVAAKL